MEVPEWTHGHDIENEKDKQRIRSHPMFPMIELLFHECEQQTSCASRDGRFHLEEEITNFGRRLELENIPLFINDAEIDSLMVKAVQVLRIHLLDLKRLMIYARISVSATFRV